MTTLSQTNGRRANIRSRCLKGARIVFANGNSTLACRIRNQSETGIRLCTDETSIVPDSFTLVQDGSTRGQLCKVTWRSPTEFGAVVVAESEFGKKGYNRSNPLLRSRNQPIGERYPV